MGHIKIVYFDLTKIIATNQTQNMMLLLEKYIYVGSN